MSECSLGLRCHTSVSIWQEAQQGVAARRCYKAISTQRLCFSLTVPSPWLLMQFPISTPSNWKPWKRPKVNFPISTPQLCWSLTMPLGAKKNDFPIGTQYVPRNPNKEMKSAKSGKMLKDNKYAQAAKSLRSCFLWISIGDFTEKGNRYDFLLWL